MAPATVGLAAVQVNIVVGSAIASREQGAVACLNYAFRLLYLPIGIFGVAIGTIATTGLAQRAAEKDMPGMQRTLRQALRMVAFLTIPSTLGLIVLGQPIIRLLFQHGKFTASDTIKTAIALKYYAVGLFAYSAVKVLAPAFYALERPRVPLYGSLLSVATNLVLNLSLYPYLGYRGVALGTAAGALVNFLILTIAFQRSVGGVRGGGLGPALAKVTVASAVMAAVAWAAAVWVERLLGGGTLLAKLATCFVPIGLALAAYAACARALGLEEMKDLWGLVKRRFGR